MKTASRVCENCGEKILGDAPKGVCPACVLETGLGPLAEEPVAGGGGSGLSADVLMNFGDYELLEEIGRGGQGVVYRARQKSLNRTVALKVIGLGQWATPAHLRRFRREAEAAASLDHPCIVPIYEVGEREGSCYFSMKFIEGGQLDQVITRKAISLRDAAELIAKLARTVHYAHEQGILHRDIKPGNILVDAKGEPHLTDFGLARLLETQSTVTSTMDVLGTPSYMAPEQAGGRNEQLTSATDVYGLGAVFYQLLTGHPPFAGGTTYETVRLVLETEPRQPRLWNPKIDRDLATICLKCLAKSPQHRYLSALALAEDLERWLRHDPIRARHTGIFARGTKWLRRNRKLVATGAACLLFGPALIWFFRSQLVRMSLFERPDKSIAVLPFENLSRDPDTAYFTEGVQEEILTRLAKIADLKVISRASTQRYQSKPRNLSEIAKQLGVANILEGSVQKAADQVRVSVQLINATTDAHLWAESYDRKLIDIFAVESDIARTIADTLKAKLTGTEEQAIAQRPTEIPEAHELYLKGRFFWNKRTGADLRKAIDYFNQAVAKDSRYALAYAGLADAYVLLPWFGAASLPDSFPQAEAAAKKALQLDDTLTEAHASLGNVLLFYHWDLEGSTREFERAIALNPNYATAHHWYGLGLAMSLGEFDRGIAELKRAQQLDPLSLIINADLGVGFSRARRYDEAIAQLRKTIEMDPHFYSAHSDLGQALELKGQLHEALAEYKKAAELSDDPKVLALLAQAYAKLGQRDEALKMLDELQQLAKQRYVANYSFALVHIALGDKAKAIECFERSYRERTGFDISLLKVNPMLDPLRGDPRFEALVQKLFAESSKTPSGELPAGVPRKR